MKNHIRPFTFGSKMTRQCYSKVSHCIFDVDGLLLDSETLYTQAIQMVLDPYGKSYDYEMKLRCMGLDAEEMGAKMVQHYDLPISPEEYMRQQDANTVALMQNCKLMPGVERLIRHLHANCVPIAVATGSTQMTFDLKTKPHAALFKLFHHIVCASSDPEVRHGKPAPDVFLVAAARFDEKPKPCCCLVFEDAPNGLQAGLKAGMQVVLIPEERLPCELSKGATQRLSSMKCFRPQDFGLPAF